jgi:hypothetical protein
MKSREQREAIKRTADEFFVRVLQSWRLRLGAAVMAGIERGRVPAIFFFSSTYHLSIYEEATFHSRRGCRSFGNLG